MRYLEERATFECAESNFSFHRCLRLGSVEAPKLWQKMATEFLANVVDLEGQRAHQICSFMWADNFWIMSHSKVYLEQTLRDLIEGAEMSDLGSQAGESVVDEHLRARREV